MYIVIVHTTDGDMAIVYDQSGRDPYLTSMLQAAKQKKKDCERDFEHYPENLFIKSMNLKKLLRGQHD